LSKKTLFENPRLKCKRVTARTEETRAGFGDAVGRATLNCLEVNRPLEQGIGGKRLILNEKKIELGWLAVLL
jgi:hypothetical protein